MHISQSERPSLETPRLVLRPFGLPDAADVQCLAGDRAVADTTLNIPHPYEDGMAQAWIETHAQEYAEGRQVNFAITLSAEGALIGCISLKMDREAPGSAELGYWVGVPWWNRGYCTEAAAAVLDYGFRVLELERIHAHHLLRNPASGRVMQKVGLHAQGVARESFHKAGEREDIALYGIRRRDWLRRAPPG